MIKKSPGIDIQHKLLFVKKVASSIIFHLLSDNLL